MKVLKMKIQTNLDKKANYYTEQTFTSKINYSKKHFGRLTALSSGVSAPKKIGRSKEINYEKFVKDFESKYIDYSKSDWEYRITNNIWAGLKSYIYAIRYKNFINKKENRENYIKLYGQNDIKFENIFVRFINIFKQLQIAIYSHIARKKELNKTGIIDGKKVSQEEISDIIAYEKDPALRRKALNAKFKMGDALRNYIVNVVTKRNSSAQALNQKSYFDLVLKSNYKIDSETFKNNLNTIYLALKPEIDEASEETNEELKKIFQTNWLEHYHYDLKVCSDEFKIFNEAIAKFGIIPLTKRIFSKMGFDIDKLINDGVLILNEDKTKKNACHMPIMPAKQSAICTSQSNNFNDLLTLCHELGHAMYNLGISQSLPLCMKKSPSKAINEAIAYIMQDVVINEDVLADIVPAKVLEKIRKIYRNEQLIKIAKIFAINEFEQEMYSNPKQDLAKLWQEKMKKYTGCNYAASNEWATLNYFICAPVHSHNNIKAKLISIQLYKHLKEKLGNLTENMETAKYLVENIFSKGASMSESELLYEILGKRIFPLY